MDPNMAGNYAIVSKGANDVLDPPISQGVKIPEGDAPTRSVLLSQAAISQVELDQLEQTDPLDAFDFLAQGVLLSRSTGQSSNVSASGPSSGSIDALLAEFRTKVLGANLFDAVEQDEKVIAEVKSLLVKLSELPSGLQFKEFDQVLEPLLEGINQTFHQRRSSQAKLDEKSSQCDNLLEEVTAFQAKLTAFRQESPAFQQQVASIDATIEQHRIEIGKLEKQKADLLAKETNMRNEAQKGIQKLKESRIFQQEIATLTNEGKTFDAKLSQLKKNLDKLTSEFVI